MIRIAWYYFRLMAQADRTAGTANGIAGWCLLAKKSYRSPSGVRITGCVTAWLRVLRKVITARHREHAAEGTPGYMIWDNRNVKDVRVQHVRSNGAALPSLFVCRNEVMIRGFGAKVNALLCLFLFFPVLLFRSCFRAHPQNTHLLPDEWLEATALLQVVKAHNVKYIYFYCPYESDANPLSLLLKAHGVTVNKIPSPNLLSIHNQEVLADVLTLTSPAQADEVSRFAATMQTGSVIRWMPEQFYQYDKVYTVRGIAPARSIGYYSHASWTREPETGNDELGDVEAELALLPVLAAFLKKHPGFSLTVFLHPREKKKDRSLVKAYYDGLFGENGYTFAPLDKPGATLFDSVDTGIGAISTILFERLFLGNKTIFYPVGVTGFPINGTAIASICAQNEIGLEQLILQCAATTASEFRKMKNLDQYTVHEWIPGADYGRYN
jgi:hypothetical protein